MTDIRQADMTKAFLTGPGEVLVQKVLAVLAAEPAFSGIFGALKDKKGDFLSWSDYPKYDWSIRQLPAVNVYESGSENKTSANGYLEGSLTVQVFWPASFRRSDLARIPSQFKAALQNFLESSALDPLLDPAPTENLATKVPGLNRFGTEMTWSPNTEGLVEDQLVPVTMVDVRYRVDLRGWYRFLETDNRTQGKPFERTLSDFTQTHGEYDGVVTGEAIPEVVLLEDVTISP